MLIYTFSCNELWPVMTGNKLHSKWVDIDVVNVILNVIKGETL